VRISARLAVVSVPTIAETDVFDDAVQSKPGTTTAVLRVGAREDVVISEAVRSVLERGDLGPT